MIDPTVALGVAGVVVQFVELGIKIVSKGYAISKSADGALEENIKAGLIAEDLFAISTKLGASSSAISSSIQHSPDPDEEALQKMANGCQDVAKELVEALQKLRPKAGDAKWKSYRQGLKCVMAKDKLDGMADQLSTYRQELQLRILVSLRKNIDLIKLQQSERFDRLDISTQALVVLLLEQKNQSQVDIRSISLAITSQHNQTRQELRQGNAEIIREIREIRQASGPPFQEPQTHKTEGHVLEPTEFWQELLDSLAFAGIGYRQDQVVEAHARTFEWIFDDPQANTRPWDSFVDWLKGEDGEIYWVSGKAGSGKSTLMKFLHDDPRMRTLLKDWAGETPLAFVGHFFWNSGDVLQMSQTGLLRVLLHEVISRYRELMLIVFAQHEVEATTTRAETRTWSLSKLRDAFEILVTQQAVPLKICFFVDGLDEYDGNYGELVAMFKRHAISPNIKFCLSSRPLVVFDDTLYGYPSLRLQDLTREDISLFVSDKLGKDQGMLKMQAEDPKATSKLIADIVDKADGVFLWVDLVTKSLLNGLQDRNSLSDLQRRVDILPSRLEELFAHMLEIIDEFYHLESSRIFQIFRAAGNEMETILLSHANHANSKLALTCPVSPLSELEMARRCSDLDIILKTRCAGLLECNDASVHGQSTNGRVVYIHRTARDFVEQSPVWAKIIAWSGKEGCDPFESLLAAHVLYLKYLPTWMAPNSVNQLNDHDNLIYTAVETVKKALSFASQGLANRSDTRVKLLDEIGKTMDAHWKAWDSMTQNTSTANILPPNDGWASHIYGDTQGYQEGPPILEHQSSMLSLAVQAGLVEYVKAKTKNNMDLIRKKNGRPLLDFTLNCEGACEQASEELIAYLLSCGASPNEQAGANNTTPWENSLVLFKTTLIRLMSTRFEERPSEFEGFLLRWVRIYILLVKNGANPNGYCQIPTNYIRRRGYQNNDYHSALDVINDALHGWLEPDDNDSWRIYREDVNATGDRQRLKQIHLEMIEAASTLQQLLVSKGAKVDMIPEAKWKTRKVVDKSGHPKSESKAEPAKKDNSRLKRLFRSLVA